jgi:hypothetical protein
MLRRRLADAEQPIFGMLLADIPRPEIRQTLGFSARELSAREGEMLRKLEVLPGEASAPSRHQSPTPLAPSILQELPPAAGGR